MRLSLVTLTAGAAALCAGCAGGSTRIATSPDNAPNIAERHRTFAPLPDPAATTTDDRHELTTALQRAVRTELTDKGYAPAPEAEADLLVSCYVNLDQELNAAERGYSDTSWREAHVTPESAVPREPIEPGVEPWETGRFDFPGGYIGMAVVVDAVDAASGELLWRGWARQQKAPRAIDIAEIADTVRLVLEEFPSREE